MADEELHVRVRVTTEGDDPAELAKGVEKLTKAQQEAARSKATTDRSQRSDEAAKRRDIDLTNKQAQAQDRLNKTQAAAPSSGPGIAGGREHPGGVRHYGGGRYQDTTTGRWLKSDEAKRRIEEAEATRQKTVSEQWNSRAHGTPDQGAVPSASSPTSSAVVAEGRSKGGSSGVPYLTPDSPTLTPGRGSRGGTSLEDMNVFLDQFAAGLKKTFTKEFGGDNAETAVAAFMDSVAEEMENLNPEQRTKVRDGLAEMLAQSAAGDDGPIKDVLRNALETQGENIDFLNDVRPRSIRERVGEELLRRSSHSRALTARGAARQAGMQGIGGLLAGQGLGGLGMGVGLLGLGAGVAGLGMAVRHGWQTGSEAQRANILMQRGYGQDPMAELTAMRMSGNLGQARQFMADARGSAVGMGFTGGAASALGQRTAGLAGLINDIPGIRVSEAQAASAAGARGDFGEAQALGLDVNAATRATKALEEGFFSLSSNSAQAAVNIAAMSDAAREAAGRGTEDGLDNLELFGDTARRKWGQAWDNIVTGLKNAADKAIGGIGGAIGGSEWQREQARRERSRDPNRQPNFIERGLSAVTEWSRGQTAQRANRMGFEEQMLPFIAPMERINVLRDMMERYPEEADRFYSMIEQAYSQQINLTRQYEKSVESINIQMARGTTDIIRNRNRSIEDLDRSFARSTEDIWRGHARSVEDININHARSLQDIFRNRDRSIEDLNIGLRRSQEDLALSFRRQMEDMEWTLENWANTSERVWTKFGHSAQYIAMNLEDQNRRFSEWMQNLQKLRDMGLSEDVVRIMGLDDVQNESQVAALVNSMDAGTLADINAQIARRVSMAQDAAPIAGAQQRERQQQRAQEDLVRNHARALEDLARNTARAVEDLNISTGRSLSDLDRNVARSIADLELNHSRSMSDMQLNTERAFEDLNRNTRNQMADLHRTIFGQFDKTFNDVISMMRGSKNDEVRSAFENMLDQLGLAGDTKGADVAKKVLEGVSRGFRVFNFVQNLLKGITGSGSSSGDGPGQGDGYGHVHSAGCKHFANGGVENHTAQFAPAGAMRMWAEPETGGEAYIPLAANKRRRSLEIWKETGKRLGVQHIDSFSDGGIELFQTLRGLTNDLAEFGAATMQQHAGMNGLSSSMMGTGSAPGRWQAMWAAVSNQFPNARLHSGYRPGAITATGNPSYHGMGRAIDISPRMDIFNWLKSNYGANIKELIFSPANNQQVWNGKNHMYSGITRDMHWDHIHWAMANGGILSYANGGIATKPQLGLFGEADNEAMVPLNAKGVRFLGKAIRESQGEFTRGLRDGAGTVAGPGYSSGRAEAAMMAVAEALAMQAVGAGENNQYGPITVVAQDPNEMERKLKQRAAYRRLTNPVSRS